MTHFQRICYSIRLINIHLQCRDCSLTEGHEPAQQLSTDHSYLSPNSLAWIVHIYHPTVQHRSFIFITQQFSMDCSYLSPISLAQIVHIYYPSVQHGQFIFITQQFSIDSSYHPRVQHRLFIFITQQFSIDSSYHPRVQHTLFIFITQQLSMDCSYLPPNSLAQIVHIYHTTVLLGLVIFINEILELGRDK